MIAFQVEKLAVQIHPDGAALGKAAARFAAGRLQSALEKRGSANLILATGASQFAFLEEFRKLDIDWQKVTVFHLDEYLGLSDQHPASFRRYLRERILELVKPRQVYYLQGDAADPQAETARYEQLLAAHPVDVACIGIGENGHIAFNDPPVADFNDPRLVKIVDLDPACRRQQLGEGWFPTLDDVPKQALSLTIPAIMRCQTISCVVPDERKSEAVYNTLYGPVSTACPASILRTHPDAVLFLDRFSATRLES
ncbi:MAG TPA: glucosamine-6-phosphate deaminase [bacterium]|nr:glucosamine-6-phosphate deaminase [bacterium]HPN45900.1 glucosamine-6-phosphate deaminase [bacterium]